MFKHISLVPQMITVHVNVQKALLDHRSIKTVLVVKSGNGYQLAEQY